MIAEIGHQQIGLRRTSKNSPDYIADHYGVSGEFSPFADMAFERHISRLEHLKRYFINENGNRIKLTIESEKLWYPLMPEEAKLIYG